MKSFLMLTTVTAALSVMLISSVHAETYGGEATGAQITVPATGTTIRAASGTLPLAGGGVEASLLIGDVPGSATGGVVALAAGAMHSAAVGNGSLTSAESSMGAVNLTISGNQITSDFIMARSQAGCAPIPSVGGASQLVSLVINGQAITVTGSPNQTVTLPNGTVVVNEQVASIVGNTAELRVTAIHVTTRDAVTGQELADVKLATADAKHGCEEQPAATQSHTTGGGWIVGKAGGKATFGFSVDTAIRSDGTFKGHLVYKDHSVNFSLKSLEIQSVTPGCTTTFSGTADSSDGPVDFQVTVMDNGEPGDTDSFEIIVVGGAYGTRADTLGGGNIQAHGASCP
jgi:hypothetical protein